MRNRKMIFYNLQGDQCWRSMPLYATNERTRKLSRRVDQNVEGENVGKTISPVATCTRFNVRTAIFDFCEHNFPSSRSTCWNDCRPLSHLWAFLPNCAKRGPQTAIPIPYLRRSSPQLIQIWSMRRNCTLKGSEWTSYGLAMNSIWLFEGKVMLLLVFTHFMVNGWKETSIEWISCVGKDKPTTKVCVLWTWKNYQKALSIIILSFSLFVSFI